MNLKKKKGLAARTLKIGKERIVFTQSRLSEIKEAITKQDIRDLVTEGAITLKPVKGRKKVNKKSGSKSTGNVRKKINKRKKEYVIMTRKLRKHVSGMKDQGILEAKEVKSIRKKIRNREFKSKANLKEYIGSIKK